MSGSFALGWSEIARRGTVRPGKRSLDRWILREAGRAPVVTFGVSNFAGAFMTVLPTVEGQPAHRIASFDIASDRQRDRVPMASIRDGGLRRPSPAVEENERGRGRTPRSNKPRPTWRDTIHASSLYGFPSLRQYELDQVRRVAARIAPVGLSGPCRTSPWICRTVSGGRFLSSRSSRTGMVARIGPPLANGREKRRRAHHGRSAFGRP